MTLQVEFQFKSIDVILMTFIMNLYNLSVNLDLSIHTITLLITYKLYEFTLNIARIT